MNLIRRKVKLFETGDYGDKGSYDKARLDSWAAYHNAQPDPIPFNIGHARVDQNPWTKLAKKIGMGIKDLYTEATEFGAELWGWAFLPEPMNDMIELGDARALSIGVPRDMSRIDEVSLVDIPHIKTAQVFNGQDNFDEVAFVFSADEFYVVEDNVTITENQEALTVAENTENTEQTPEATQVETPVEKQEFSADERTALNAEIAKIKAERDEANRLLFAERDEAKVNQLEKAGKILPIHKEALLSFSGAGNINFSGEDTRVFDAVCQFMENYDVSAVFEATQPETTPVPNPIEEETNVFTADAETEKALARMARMFGCSVEDLKKSNAHLAKSAKGAN